MGGHGGGKHITCINMPIQNKYQSDVALVSSVQNLYYVATVAQSSGLCLTFGAVLHTWNYLCFIIWIYTAFRTMLNTSKLMLVHKQMPLYPWVCCMELILSRADKTGHVEPACIKRDVKSILTKPMKYECACNANFKKFMTNLWFLTVLEE